MLGTATSATDAAAGATEGQALYYGGRPADVYYTASCGGHTERPSGAWPGSIDPPYLPARPEPTCVGRDRWETDVTAGELGRALATTGRRGEMVRDLRITGRTASGRVASLQVLGLAPSDITGGDLRAAVGRTLGWQVLKSTLFSVTRTASGYRFTGSGRGHGVGLCVTGAARMAVAGDSSRAILAHYFPGAQIVGAGPSPGTIHISVPVGEERERERILSIGAAALREYSAKLGVRPPATVRVVAHPTVDAYTRATGQPWWTAGATRASRIDLIPLASLRQRAILEPTLRHEFAHVDDGGAARGTADLGAGSGGDGPCRRPAVLDRERQRADCFDRRRAVSHRRRVAGAPFSRRTPTSLPPGGGLLRSAAGSREGVGPPLTASR